MTDQIRKMQLTRAEKLACKNFAAHLATCDWCLSRYHKPGGWDALCDNGINLRDAHVEAARARAKVDYEFGKHYASLVA